MIEYISYILFFTTLIIFIIYIYIKIKYGFWVYQPVFHVYDIGYYFHTPGIINHSLPEKNKYTNFKNIDTTVYDNLSKLQITRFINLIKANYLQNRDNIFNPHGDNIVPYFYGHNSKSFVSFYNEDNFMVNLTNGTTIEDKKIIGVMTSRPLSIIINNGNSEAKFDAYYVDYLCVDQLWRKKGIAQQLIQTHHYNQRHINKEIVVSLFKREDELTGIVPLCAYSTYGFPVKSWTKPPHLDAVYKIVQVNAQNFHYLLDFIKLRNSSFDILISSSPSNIIELIKTKNIFIYIIIVDDEIISAYFYRKSCVQIEKGLEVLSCFASINNTDENIFIQGFKISFWKCAADNYFGFAAIENISHNNIIIENILLKTRPSIISPTAYFFYNFAYPTFISNKVLIVN
jgi:GNAT superfamily N-acetyltransferase